ncbi:Lsr2 family DNA-binding protein [Streptomyces sp. NPDC004230]
MAPEDHCHLAQQPRAQAGGGSMTPHAALRVANQGPSNGHPAGAPSVDPQLKRGLSALLWAEQQGDVGQVCKDRAAQVRELLAELEDHRAKSGQAAKVADQLKTLSLQLASARARQARIGGTGLGSAVIRVWARQQGLPVSSGGALRADVIDAFERSLGVQTKQHKKTIAEARLDTEIRRLKGCVTAARERLSRLQDYLPSAAAVRAWAKSQGMDVPDVGLLPLRIVEAWKAHNQQTSLAQAG